MKRRAIAILFAATWLALTPAMQAEAALLSHVVVAFGGNYVPYEEADLPVVITEGDRLFLLVFEQNEQPFHDLTHCVLDEFSRCTVGPLFGSETVHTGEIGEVFGVDEIPQGEYLFYCVIHPTTMRGELTVLPSLG